MQTKTEAIVLRTVKYGDNKTIVDLLTRQDGRVAFAVTLPKKGRGKVSKQILQPLTLLDVSYDLRPRMQLQRLAEATLHAPYSTIPFDAAKLSITLFLSDFLAHALGDVQGDEPLYLYIKDSLLWLDAQEGSCGNFHLVFLMRLARFLGFFPNLEGYREGDCFDLQASCFTPHAPAHRHFLAPDEARKLALLMRMNYQTMRLFRMTREERNRLLDVALEYYTIHIPAFPELKSVEVVRELFA